MTKQEIFDSTYKYLMTVLRGIGRCEIFDENDQATIHVQHVATILTLAKSIINDCADCIGETIPDTSRTDRRDHEAGTIAEGTRPSSATVAKDSAPFLRGLSTNSSNSESDSQKSDANALLLPPKITWTGSGGSLLPVSPLLTQYREISTLLFRSINRKEPLNKTATEMTFSPVTDATIRDTFIKNFATVSFKASSPKSGARNSSADNKARAKLPRASLPPSRLAIPQEGIAPPMPSDDSLRHRHKQIAYQIFLAAKVADVTCFKPQVLAFEISIQDQMLFDQIGAIDLILHKPPDHVTQPMQAHAEWFNYLARLVEFTILERATVPERAQVILHWLAVAHYLEEFRNLNGLQAVVFTLTGPAISRLRRTWETVPAKHLQALDALMGMVSPEGNFERLRSYHAKRDEDTRPFVPCLGLYVHDCTYYIALMKNESINESARRRFSELWNELDHHHNRQKYAVEQLSAQMLMEQSSKKKNTYSLLSTRIPTQLEFLRHAEDETVGTFVLHWILSRKCYAQKELDELSRLREPKIQDESSTGTLCPPTPLELKRALSARIQLGTQKLPQDPPYVVSPVDYLSAHAVVVPPELIGAPNIEALLFKDLRTEPQQHQDTPQQQSQPSTPSRPSLSRASLSFFGKAVGASSVRPSSASMHDLPASGSAVAVDTGDPEHPSKRWWQRRRSSASSGSSSGGSTWSLEGIRDKIMRKSRRTSRSAGGLQSPAASSADVVLPSSLGNVAIAQAQGPSGAALLHPPPPPRPMANAHRRAQSASASEIAHLALPTRKRFPPPPPPPASSRRQRTYSETAVGV